MVLVLLCWCSDPPASTADAQHVAAVEASQHLRSDDAPMPPPPLEMHDDDDGPDHVSNTVVVETAHIQPVVNATAPMASTSGAVITGGGARAGPSSSASAHIPHDELLGRWRLSLDLFARVFCDDVGAEVGSVISELGGFPVKETRFRRDMEKLRNSQQKDLSLEVRHVSAAVTVHGCTTCRLCRVTCC